MIYYLILGFILRLAFYLFGIYQDANWPLPYTDIDYYVFTDAAKFVSNGESPFLRATYRYTPLLAWCLTPTTKWFSFGKFIFIVCDLLTGYLILINLRSKFKHLSLIWILNPMVITISTRGSSESILTSFILLTIHLLVSSQQKSNTNTNTNSNSFKLILSGLIFGICVHLKIYPFIYAPTFLLFLGPISPLINFKRLLFTLSSLISFIALTYWMYIIYGYEYIYESFIYHLVRLDHRHNFSVYNTLLYYTSYDQINTLSIEKLAFIPQLGLTLVVIPLCFKKAFQLKAFDIKVNLLLKILFIQTFTFITFNKVCTSQYFLWFLCFLPQYISTSCISWQKAIILGILWVLSQGFWLFNGWRLEFMGELGVFDWLFFSSGVFFLINVLIICVFIRDVSNHLGNEIQLEKNKS